MCSAERTYFFLLFGCDTARLSVLCAPSVPPLFFVTELHIKKKHPAGLQIRGQRINHSPHSPVRAGPHLPQALVPLRYLPCGVVDFLADVSGSDS